MNRIKIYIYLFFISFLFSINNNLNNSELIKENFILFMNNSYNNKTHLDQSNNQNIFLGAFLSAIIPGTGQIYNKDYKRGVGYLTLELLSWSYRENYISKSKFYEKKYKNYANEHWSFQKWIRDYCLFADPTNPVYGTMINDETGFFYPWEDSHHIEFFINEELKQTNNSNGSDWFEDTYVAACPDNDDDNKNYTRIESCDTDFFLNSEVIKDHNFYEGLGKYELFFPGWDDTHECEQSVLDEYGNCSFVVHSGNTDNAFTYNKKYYQYQLRSKANKKSDYAENALTLIFVNHAVSMFDAFISNMIKNKDFNFNYYSHPIYNYNSSLQLEGINISVSW